MHSNSRVLILSLASVGMKVKTMRIQSCSILVTGELFWQEEVLNLNFKVHKKNKLLKYKACFKSNGVLRQLANLNLCYYPRPQTLRTNQWTSKALKSAAAGLSQYQNCTLPFAKHSSIWDEQLHKNSSERTKKYRSSLGTTCNVSRHFFEYR